MRRGGLSASPASAMVRAMRRPLLLSILLLASCVPRAVAPPALVERPKPQPLPPPIPSLPAPVAVEWRDRPQTPGTWTYRHDARESIALFGTTGTDALLTLRCDLGARQVYLARAGSSTAPLVIRTSSTTRQLMVRLTGGTPPYVAAALAPTDPLLDAIGFSRGRFAVEQAGTAPLAIPAWAEIERVTEDCRG